MERITEHSLYNGSLAPPSSPPQRSSPISWILIGRWKREAEPEGPSQLGLDFLSALSSLGIRLVLYLLAAASGVISERSVTPLPELLA